jgi:hypothetical protein
VTMYWTAESGITTITGRTFQADNVFHQVVARVQVEIEVLLRRKTGAKKVLTDPDHFGITDSPPYLPEQFNFYTFEPDTLSDSLRKRLAHALSAVIGFWRKSGRFEGSRLWNNKSFLESLEHTEGLDDDTRWLRVVAGCLLCLDRALVHGNRGHVWEGEDWFECTTQLRFVLVTWGEKKAFQKILGMFEQQDAKARAQTRNASKRRHAKTREAREKVLRDWQKERHRFRSAAQAGVYYSDRLAEQGYQFEPHTVTGWILDYLKKLR